MNWKSRAIQLRKKDEGIPSKILGKMSNVCSVVTSILMVVIACQANFILEKQNAYMVAVSSPVFVNESPVENENGVLFNFTQVDGYADNLQGNAYDAVFIDVYPEYGDRDQAKTIELNIYGLYNSSLELYSDKPRVVVSEEKALYLEKKSLKIV